MPSESIQSHDQLIDHLFFLMDDFDAIGNQWNNQDIYTFLQAMADWLENCEKHYQKNGAAIDVNKPSWQLFADACQPLLSMICIERIKKPPVGGVHSNRPFSLMSV